MPLNRGAAEHKPPFAFKLFGSFDLTNPEERSLLNSVACRHIEHTD